MKLFTHAHERGAAIAMMEASGPVRVKQVYNVRDELAREQAERRARNKALIEAEQARKAAIRAQTPDHVWDRISRDEKRRADRKAAKKAAKKAQR